MRWLSWWQRWFKPRPVHHPFGVAVGGVLAGIGGTVSVGVACSPDSRALIIVVGIGLVIVGVLLIVWSCYSLQRRTLWYHPEWNPHLVKAAIEDAPGGSTLRIAQTWLPDAKDFIPLFLQPLLLDGRDIRLEILLMDPGSWLVSGRARLRTDLYDKDGNHAETTADREAVARGQLQFTLEKIKEMKDAIFRARDETTMPHFDLSIGLYSFAPFGPVYWISTDSCGDGKPGKGKKDRMFVGVYPNFRTSAAAPMVELKDKTSEAWKVFADHWQHGWKDAEEFDIDTVKLPQKPA